MSHHSHIGGHAAHVHTPNMGHADYKAAHYDWKSWHSKEETEAVGWSIGQAFRWFFTGTFTSIAYGGSTVIDTLRLKTPAADFFEWQRVPGMWLGLLSLALLSTGCPGYYLMLGIGFLLVFSSGRMKLVVLIAFVLAAAFGGDIGSWLGGALPIPVLNALLAIPIPAVQPRLELMGTLLEPAGRGQELMALAQTNLAGASLLQWYTRLDRASLAIPFVLTLVATVKYVRLARARNFIDGDDRECHPASPALVAWFAFALLLVLLGLPGAPFGLWVLVACLGWLRFGRTKTSAAPDHAEYEATSGASFDLSSTPVPPPAPRPAPTRPADDSALPLREFEEAERARKQNPPLRRDDYHE